MANWIGVFCLETMQLYCGDFRDLLATLPEHSIDAVITDPPYNIGFQGYRSYSDNLPDEEYIGMLCELQQMPVAMIHYPEEMMRWVVPALGPPDHVSAWCYNSNIPRRFRLIGYWGGLRPDYSRIKVPYKNLNDKRIQGLLGSGSLGTSLYEWWDDIQIVKNVSREKTEHPCPIPVSLIERLILLCTDEGDTVFDPFMGSGTTGLACCRLGRNFIGCELDPGYYELAERRISELQLQAQLI